MKEYIYVDLMSARRRIVKADGLEVTTGGELIFSNDSEHGIYIVFAVAPGVWAQVWERGTGNGDENQV